MSLYPYLGGGSERTEANQGAVVVASRPLYDHRPPPSYAHTILARLQFSTRHFSSCTCPLLSMPPKRKATDAGSDSSSGSSPAKPSKAIKAVSPLFFSTACVPLLISTT